MDGLDKMEHTQMVGTIENFNRTFERHIRPELELRYVNELRSTDPSKINDLLTVRAKLVLLKDITQVTAAMLLREKRRT